MRNGRYALQTLFDFALPWRDVDDDLVSQLSRACSRGNHYQAEIQEHLVIFHKYFFKWTRYQQPQTRNKPAKNEGAPRGLRGHTSSRSTPGRGLPANGLHGKYGGTRSRPAAGLGNPPAFGRCAHTKRRGASRPACMCLTQPSSRPTTSPPNAFRRRKRVNNIENAH